MTFMAYFGHLNIDVTISVENIATKGSAAATGLRRQFGGTLGNFAYIASALGLDFHPYSAVSSRSHSEFLSLLRSRDIDLSGVQDMKELEGPLCYIISDRKEQNAYMFQGPMDQWKPDAYFKPDSYRYVHFSTGPPESYLKIADANDSVSVFDPSQELFYKYDSEQIRKFVSRSRMIMGNRQEVEQILSSAGLSLERNTGDIDIVMTDGRNGTLGIVNGERHRVRGFTAESVFDTIGAGDAFRAGFYTALYRGMKIPEAMAVGNITASKAISQPIFEFHESWESVMDVFRAEKNRLMD